MRELERLKDGVALCGATVPAEFIVRIVLRPARWDDLHAALLGYVPDVPHWTPVRPRPLAAMARP